MSGCDWQKKKFTVAMNLTKQGQKNYDEIFRKKTLKTRFEIDSLDLGNGLGEVKKEIEGNIIIMERGNHISVCCNSLVDVMRRQHAEVSTENVIVELYYTCRKCLKECEIK